MISNRCNPKQIFGGESMIPEYKKGNERNYRFFEEEVFNFFDKLEEILNVPDMEVSKICRMNIALET